MEHDYEAYDDAQDHISPLIKQHPQFYCRQRWLLSGRQLWQKVWFCFRAARRIQSSSVVWWRHPLAGYVVAALLQCLIIFLFIRIFPDDAFPDIAALLVVLIIARIWGIGPGFFATFAGALFLSLFSIIPQSTEGLPWQYLIETALFLLAGMISCLVVCSLELARVKAENSRQQFYNLFVQGPANVMMLRGETHMIEFANSMMRQTLGRTTLVGQTVAQALPEIVSQGFVEKLNRVYATGIPFVGTEVLIQIDRHGNGCLEEGYFSFIYQPAYNMDGTVEGIMVHAVEVTESVRARQRAEELLLQLQAEQQALCEREQLFRLLAENAEDVIYRYRISPTFACEYISPSVTAITGYTPEEYYAEPFLTLKRLYPGYWPILEGYWHGIHSLDDPLLMRGVHKNGDVVWMEQRNKLVYDQDGNVVALEGISRDITARKQAEETLLASEKMYRTIVHTANEGIWLVDAEARTIFVNDRMAAMLGYTAEEMATFTVTDMAFPESRQSAQTRFDNNLKGHFEQFDCRFLRKDGHIVYALGCTSPVRDGSNNIVGALGMFTDVTERQRLALKLEEQVRELEAIFEAVADGVLVYDNQGHILRANPAYHALVGSAKAPVYLKLTIDARGDLLVLRDEHGEPLPYARWPIIRVLHGEVLTGKNRAEIILRTFHGHDVQLNVTGAPTRDQEGNITGGVLVFHDVTEHRKLEYRTRDTLQALLVLSEELAQSFEKDTTVGTMTPDVIAQRLATLVYQELGCEKVSVIMVEPKTDELRSISFAGVTAEQEQQWRKWMTEQAFSEHLQELRLDERLRSAEVRIVDLRQPPLHHHPDIDGMQKVILAPIQIGKQLLGILALDYGTQEDVYTQARFQLIKAVTKRLALVLQRVWLLAERAEARANEQALREANRLMDEFIGVAAHEIQTPLTVINASVQQVHRQLSRLAERKVELPDDLAELTEQGASLLNRVQRQVEIENRLVNNILDVSRSHAYNLELNPQLCNIVAFVADVVEEQSCLVPACAVNCMLPSAEIFVMADAGRLKQVINHYLSSVLKYAEKGQSVAVGVQADGTMVRVHVCHEGAVLSDAERQRLWERFYPTTSIGVNADVSPGPGLQISRTIIEKQGGQVGIGTTPGESLTLWFTLPQARL